MIDVIEIFGSNFIIVSSESSDSDSENSENLKNSENSVDFKKFEKFMTDLFQRIYIYDYVDFFLFNFINTMITIRIDSNDRFFSREKIDRSLI